LSEILLSYLFYAIFLVMKAPRKQNVGRIESGAPKGAAQNTTMLLLTMADTTWRIFVPAILFTAPGIWGDLHFGTKPWLTFTGLLVGFVAAGLLVRKQLKTIQR
jgi:hypothetical protein